MNITIIGAGNMARGIGTRLVEGGHAVTVVDTDGEKARALAAELGARKAGARATVTSTAASGAAAGDPAGAAASAATAAALPLP